MSEQLRLELEKISQWLSKRRPAAWYPDQEQAFSVWAEAIHDEDASLREATARVLGYFDHHPKAEPLLDQLWNDPLRRVRMASLQSMMRVNPENAEQKAFQAVNDRNEYIRIEGIKVLKALNSEWYSKAYQYLEQHPSKLIQEALRSL